MKKAKRLLAILLAFVMLASATCVSVYARQAGTSYTPTRAQALAGHTGSDDKFFFSAEEGCAYILDILDDFLANAHIYYTWEDMGLDGIVLSLVKSATGTDHLDLTSIDAAVNTVYGLLHAVKDNDNIIYKGILSAFGDSMLKDLNNLRYSTLNTGIKRGVRPNYTGASTDLNVLYMVISWLQENNDNLVKIANGSFDFGLLSSALPDMIKDIPGFLTNLLYTKLINSDLDEMPSNTTIDAGLQQLINWALIDGTGETAATGANSVLGSNFEPLLAAMGNEPGGASITATSIRALRKNSNNQLVMTNTTMDTYQLVSNAINGALNSIVGPLLVKLFANMFDVEATEQYPYGDPAIMAPSSDMMTLSNIVGLVAGLCKENGAPEFSPTEAQQQYPLTYIQAFVDYFFSGANRALDTFINVNYYGISLTDNLLALLATVARLAVSLIPGFGLLDGAETVAYTADELNAQYFYNKTSKQIVDPANAGTEEVEAYVTWEDGTPVYRAEPFDTLNPVYYYCSNGRLVDGNDYNLTLVKPYYVISTHQVYACLLKMVFNHFIAGCYFPEWCQDVPTTCAYALASFAATTLPGNNYFLRLDGYHYLGNQVGSYTTDIAGESVTVETLPYTAQKSFGGSTYTIPKAALDIGASVLAYYTNSYFMLNNDYFCTDTTLERFATEFLIWGATKYMPILFGSRQANGVYTTATFSAATNGMMDAIYSNKADRVLKANPNWDYIYTMIDNSLLKLLPNTWLPTAYNSTFKLINGWLCQNIVNFDLQGILSILSVNDSANAELKQPLSIVLLRVVDRVLAIVFGNHAVLPDDTRSNVYSVNTTVTTFTNLLSGSTLGTLLGNLIKYLNQYKVQLAETIFPLLMRKFELPYRTSLLGTDMSRLKIANLENYIKVWNDNLNATLVGTYNTIGAATEVKEAGENRYIETIREGVGLDAVSTYKVWESVPYLASATQSAAKYDENSVEGEFRDVTLYHTYNNFNHATATTATAGTNNGLSQWTDGYIFARYEDSQPNYYFNNRSDALKDAASFVESYNSYATETLPGAYADWLAFEINARLYAAGKFDSNDDGVVDENDGMPGVPSADYPFYGDSTNFTWRDKLIDNNVTQAMNTFNGTNYEQIAIALALGADSSNNVELAANRAEAVVRLALNTLAFDITQDGDGHYNSGSKQWAGLTDAEKNTIATFCTGLGLTYDRAANKISRPAFKLFTTSDTFGISGLAAKPVTSKISGKDLSDVQEMSNDIWEAYTSYVNNLYATRRSLYNQIDLVTYRVERFETVGRRSSIDTTMLKWVLDKVNDAYVNNTSNARNLKIVTFVNGQPVYSKVYTQSSYAAFRDAYDYAKSLNAFALTGSGDDAGLTQSMVTAAYRGVIDTYKALVPYTGDADWSQLDEYIALAQSIINDPVQQTENGCTAASLAGLQAVLDEGIALRADTTIDCEGQYLVDAAANAIIHYINNDLVWKQAPNLSDGDANNGIQLYQSDIQTGIASNRPTGILYGIEEGQIVNVDDLIGNGGALSLSGMVLNPEIGNSVQLGKADRGYGTGSPLIGRLGGQERFRYYLVIFGDLNGDTRVDGTDASRLLYQYTLNSSDMTDGLSYAQSKAADVDHDGDVDMADINMIQHYYMFDYGTNNEYRIVSTPVVTAVED